MMTKRITAESVSVVKTSSPGDVNLKTYDFPVNTRILLGEKIYQIRKSYRESSTDFRLLLSDGNEEIYTLDSLRSMANEASVFKVFNE